jgi:hypothetical protein
LLDRGGLDDAEQRRKMVAQLGAALAYAHEAGIVHGGFSPDAVLVDSSGNAYLTGISFVLRLAGAPRPTSRYTAPETRDGGPVDAAADVFALGVLAGEFLDDVDAVAARATATDPADRFASVAELITQLGGASAESAVEPAFTVTRNPYKGLEAFSESDSGDFFGRTQAVADLVAQVAAHRLVAVVGPSGSGKSSLVRAGFIPAVRSGDLDGSQQWLVTAMLPGSYPFEELESALARVAVKDPGGLMDELARDERGLVRVIKRVLPADTRLLLVIDQFEEVFTLTRDTETRDRFLRALVAVAADDRADVRVVVTLRADFFDRPLQHPEFGALLTAGMFPITTPSADDLAEAVRRPAETVGVGFETGLVEQIVADVADAPGSLPLLQYALTELFAARTSDVLTHDHYRATGGVLGALGTRADAIHDQLDPRQRALARQVFLRMVTVQASGEPTRRRARLPELNAIADPAEVNVILTAFGDARLLTFDRDPLTRSPSAEVAHEAMLTRWPRLADWIVAAREDLLLHRRVADSVTEWANHDRSDDYLLTGGRLAQFQTWAATTDLTLTTEETTYLDHSTRRDDHQRATRRRRRNLVTTGFAVVAAVATLAGILAFISRQDAADKADQANVATLISRSEAARADEPTVSVLLALEAHRRAPGPETEGAVLTAMSRLGPLVRTFPPFPPVDDSGGPPKRESSWGSADGFSQSSQIDGRAVRLSLVTGEIFDIGELPEPDAQWVGDQDADRGIAHSLDSSRFWLGPYAGPWDTVVEPAQPMALLDEALASNRVVMATQVGAYMGNGFWDVAGDETTTVMLIDATTGEQVGPGIEGVRALNQVATAISSDSAMIAVGMRSSGGDDSGLVVVLDAETGTELSRIDVPALIARMVFDTAAGELIVGTDTARVVTIDVESGEIIADVATSIGSEIVGLGLRSDGGVVVVGLGLAEIVDRRQGPTGEPGIELLGGGTVVRPDDTLVVTEASGQIEVYDFGSGALVEQRVGVGPDGYVAGIGSGRALVDTNGRVELVDLATNERAEVESVPEEFYLPVSIQAEGTGGIIIGPDGYRLGRFESGQLVEQVAMAPADFQLFRGEIDDQLDLGAGVFLRPDGGFEVQGQNVAPGQLEVTLRLDVEAEPAAYPAPDGGVYVTLGDGTFRHYDSTGSVVSEIDTGIFNPYLAALDHGSGRVAFAAGTVIGPDSAVIIDPATGEMHTIPDIGGVANIEFARDGELLAMMGFDGSVRLWNVEQQEFAGVIWDGTGARFNEALHYDESTDSLWVPSSGQLLRLPLNPARWVERACEFVGGDFTQTEWDEYVPGGGAVQSACA